MKSNSLAQARKRDAAKLTQGLRGIVIYLVAVSCLINVLALTGSLYMMQVYDRALTSGSVQTLMALSAIALVLFLFQGGFDAVRSRILLRIGARFDRDIAPTAHRVAIDMPRFGFSTTEAIERGARCRYRSQFPGGAGTCGALRHAVDPDLSRLHLPAASLAGCFDPGGRRRPDAAHDRQ